MRPLRHLLILSGSVVFCSLSISMSVGAQTASYVVTDLGRSSRPAETPLEYQCDGQVGDCPRLQMVANANGQMAFQAFVVGTAIDAYYWEPGMATPVLAGGRVDDASRVVAISSNGFVTGIQDSGFVRAYRWSRATGPVVFEPIDFAFPLGVNAAGVVVGQVSVGGIRAAIWDGLPASRTPTYLDDLNIAGKERWQFQTARTISDSGVIGGVGMFTTDTGATEPHFFALTPGGGNGALDRRDWTVVATEASPSDPPKNAIDGNLNTRWSTGRAQHDSQGFIVSWSGDRTIGRIRMEVGPSVNDYPRTCGIWVKDTAGQVTFVNCVADSSGVVDVTFSPIPANKIEVWQWGTTTWWWSIAEFNVFAK